jgi:N-acetylglucosaminyl-diphospho-decaprenol L-rhamnosyltransferase
MPDVANRRLHVVVVNYRSAQYLARCVPSLPAHCDVIVFNNSPEESAELAHMERAREGLRVVEGSGNIGFGPAFNAVLSAGGFDDDDLVWLLNPDTIVEDGCVEALLAAAGRGVEPLLLSPVVVTDPGGRVWFAGGAVNRESGAVRHFQMNAAVDDLADADLTHNFMSGAALLASGRTWRLLGGFREDLFLYWEDADLSLRASQMGVRLAVVPTARVRHMEGGSSRSGDPGKSSLYYYYTARNRLIVCRDGRFARVWLLLGRGAWHSAHTVGLIMLRERVGRLGKLRAWLVGSLDGIVGRAGRRWPR